MPVTLYSSRGIDRIPKDARKDAAWVATVVDKAPELDQGRCLEGVAASLERAFESCRDQWMEYGRAIQATRSGRLAHAAACHPMPSDLGAMLAWVKLVEDLAAASKSVSVICDDPWLFKRLSRLRGVTADTPPRAPGRRFLMKTRGYLVRGWLGLKYFRYAALLRSARRVHKPSQPCILVPGHISSTPGGHDACFGSLHEHIEGLQRVLHTDCDLRRAKELAGNGHSVSLHAWGNPWAALLLPFKKWTLSDALLQGPDGELLQRAADIEGAGGAGAATWWQIHCQKNWLVAQSPKSVAWPWEGHPWERQLVADARGCGVRSVGSQHSTVGPHMWSVCPRSLINGPVNGPAGGPAAGLAGLPDMIACNGEAYKKDLIDYGIPKARLVNGGALRFGRVKMPKCDPDAPIFVALPGDMQAARELVLAVRKIAETNPRWNFLIKDHPTYGFAFSEKPNLRRTTVQLQGHKAVSKVIYCASTVGVESALAGLPTLRFLCSHTPAMNILPAILDLPAADHLNLHRALQKLAPPPQKHDRSLVFSEVDLSVWHDLLEQNRSE